MDQQVASGLPRYRSHKIVEAAIIATVITTPPGLVLALPDGTTVTRSVTAEYMSKHSPIAGGYFVRYNDDGYESWSPFHAFEQGYRRIETGTAGDEQEGVDAKVERIARVCHEVNRAYCAALGDFTQAPWESAPLWQRDSARAGVRMHLEHPDASPAASHESWMAQKVADGWVRGDAKDPERKTHPCIVSFSELPVAQQAKDFIFRGVVHALA